MWVRTEEQQLVGACLAAARTRAGNQRELAGRLAKPQSFVSAYENGQRRIDLLEFLVICDALGADPLALFGEIVQHQPAKADALKNLSSRR